MRRLEDGRLHGDLFDGEGFVRALNRKGCQIAGARAFVAGAGGVGAAIAASLAAAGARSIALWDIEPTRSRALANRLGSFYSDLELTTDVDHPADRDILVNATPMGMNENDPLPMNIEEVKAEA